MRWAVAVAISLGLAAAQVDMEGMSQRLRESQIGNGMAAGSLATGDQANPWRGVVDAWNWTGNTLSQACRFLDGSPVDLRQILGLPFSVPVPMAIRPQPELEWVCSAARLWQTVNGYIAQDWGRTVGEIAGTWIGDIATGFLTSLGIEAGSHTWSQAILDLNDTIRRSYRDFMRSAYSLVWQGISQRLNEMRRERWGQRRGDNTPQGRHMEKFVEEVSKMMPQETLQTIEGAFSAAPTMEKLAAIGGMETVRKQVAETKKASSENLVRERSKYTGFTQGGLNSPGQIQVLKDQARTAASSREVLEVVNTSILELLQVQLTSTDILLQALYGILDTQTMTNQLLATQIRLAGGEVLQLEDRLKEQINEIAEENAQINYMVNLIQGAYEGMLEGLTR